jgi:hypothetical protein
MRCYLLFVLLLTGCSSSTPLRRGTPVAPPTFRPAEDAPHTVGQPGHVRQPQSYPRSPPPLESLQAAKDAAHREQVKACKKVSVLKTAESRAWLTLSESVRNGGN